MRADILLYTKQGDDFDYFLEKTNNNVSQAFALMADDFKEMAEKCKALSVAMNGYRVSVVADGQFLMFEGEDKKADKMLETLVEQKLLDKSDTVDEENEDE